MVPSYWRQTSSHRIKEGNVKSFRESAPGWTLGKVNVWVRTKGAPKGGQDTVTTLRTIIWYKRAGIKQTRDNFLSTYPLEHDINQNVVIEQVLN